MSDKVTLKKSEVPVHVYNGRGGFMMGEIDGFKLVVNKEWTGLYVHKFVSQYNTSDDKPLILSSRWVVGTPVGLALPSVTDGYKAQAILFGYALWQGTQQSGAPYALTEEWFTEKCKPSDYDWGFIMGEYHKLVADREGKPDEVSTN